MGLEGKLNPIPHAICISSFVARIYTNHWFLFDLLLLASNAEFESAHEQEIDSYKSRKSSSDWLLNALSLWHMADDLEGRRRIMNYDD